MVKIEKGVGGCFGLQGSFIVKLYVQLYFMIVNIGLQMDNKRKMWECLRMSTKVYGYTRKDKIQNDCIQEDIGVTTIEEKMTKN